MKLLTDYIDLFRKRINRRDYKGIFFSCMGFLFIIATAVLVLWAAIIVFTQLIHVVADNLMYIAGFALLAIWGTIYIKGKMQEKRDKMEEQRTRDQLERELAHQAIGEDSYQTARQAMFTILSSIAQNCNLQPPEDLSSLDAPRHFVTRDGNLLFQFVALKRGEISSRTIITLIETRTRQMANAHELNFEPSNIIVFGQVYPALLVDSIVDCQTYVQINIAFVTESFIRSRIERERQNRLSPFASGGNDHDF